MKFKLHVVCTDPEKFVQGHKDAYLNLFPYEPGITGWVTLGEIEFELDVNMIEMLDVANAELDNKISKSQAMVELYQNAKKDLLAISYDPQPGEDG